MLCATGSPRANEHSCEGDGRQACENARLLDAQPLDQLLELLLLIVADHIINFLPLPLVVSLVLLGDLFDYFSQLCLFLPRYWLRLFIIRLLGYLFLIIVKLSLFAFLSDLGYLGLDLRLLLFLRLFKVVGELGHDGVTLCLCGQIIGNLGLLGVFRRGICQVLFYVVVERLERLCSIVALLHPKGLISRL